MNTTLYSWSKSNINMTFIAGRHQFIFFSFPEQTQNVYCVISSNFRTSPSEKKVFNKFYTKLKGRFSNVVQIMLLNIRFLNSLYVVSIFSFLLSVILLPFGCTLAFVIKYFQLIRERPKAEKSALLRSPK